MPTAPQPLSEPCPAQGCEQAMNFHQLVVGRGNPRAPLMLISEAPGASEDSLAKPFVGRSGKLLDRLLISVGFDTDRDVYICNAVKCRPPKNRRPTAAELLACRPWLDQQIALVDPAVIVLAGSTAMEAILGIKGGISRLRGRWQQWHGRWLMPLFHPAYLLRNPSEQEGQPVALTRADLVAVRQRLSTLKPGESVPVLDSVGGSNP